MRAFVTGGSGFLGRNLIRILLERGDSVVALARSDPAERAIAALGAATVVRGDLDQVDVMTRAMDGCDVVFHSAALAADWGDPALFHRVNVQGTENVLRAARAAAVPRVVHVSTEAVLVDGRPIVNADETRPRPERPVGLYPITKGLAEAAVLAASRDGLDAMIVRPRLIWGAGDTTVLPRLIDAIESGAFRWIAGGDYLTSTCHVDNVVEGMLLAAERGRGGEIYFLTDGQPHQFREFMGALLDAAGVEPGDKNMPRWAAKFLATVVEGVWKVSRRAKSPPITRTGLLLVGQEVTVDDSKARRELGYCAQVSLEAGLAGIRAERAASGSLSAG